jgi:hypothetical protein
MWTTVRRNPVPLHSADIGVCLQNVGNYPGDRRGVMKVKKKLSSQHAVEVSPVRYEHHLHINKQSYPCNGPRGL